MRKHEADREVLTYLVTKVTVPRTEVRKTGIHTVCLCESVNAAHLTVPMPAHWKASENTVLQNDASAHMYPCGKRPFLFLKHWERRILATNFHFLGCISK